MSWLFRVLLLAALMVPGVAAAQVGDGCAVRGGITSPIALVSVNGVCIDLSSSIAVGDKVSTLNLQDVSLLGVSILDITATFNEDPFITFGAATTNVVAGPITYAFLFGTPIVPGFYDTASSTGGVSVSNTPGGDITVDNSAVYPTYISGYGTVGAVPTNLGVDLGTDPCAALGPGLATTVCGQGTVSNSFAPTFYDNLEALLTYTQTGLGTAAWSGTVSLDVSRPGTSVPEPVTVTLLAVSAFALGAVGIARRRRRQG